jgi:BclB C-terminal domain-containing protein
LGGIASVQALISFGTNDTAVIVGGIIDTTGTSSFAFSMPRDGVITSIAAYYSVGVALAIIGTEITISAQLYSSTTPDNIFAPVIGSLVSLSPVLTGLVSAGTSLNGIATGLSIPVSAQTRLMMVFSAEVTSGIDIATIISGAASAGVSIE